MGGLPVSLLLLAAVGLGVCRSALPRLTGRRLSRLQHEVTFERRSQWGVQQLRAASLEELEEAQGYVMAQVRLWPDGSATRVWSAPASESLVPQLSPLTRISDAGNQPGCSGEGTVWTPRIRKVMGKRYARGSEQFIEGASRRLPLESLCCTQAPAMATLLGHHWRVGLHL